MSVQVDRKLSEGTYGAVYAVTAFDEFGGQRKEAVKLFYDITSYEQFCSVMRELDVLFRFNSRNLIEGFKIYSKHDSTKLFSDLLDEDRKPNPSRRPSVPKSIDTVQVAVSEEFLSGDLSQLIGSNMISAVRKEVGFKLVRQISKALVCLWHGGYFYNDLKPTNILFKRRNALNEIQSADDIDFYLGDYGMSIPCIPNANSLIIDGINHVGTYVYQPYEVLNGGQNDFELFFNACTWSLGMCLLEFLYQQVLWTPSHGNNYNSIKKDHFTSDGKDYTERFYTAFDSITDRYDKNGRKIMGLLKELLKLENRPTPLEILKEFFSNHPGEVCQTKVLIYDDETINKILHNLAYEVKYLNEELEFEKDYFYLFYLKAMNLACIYFLATREGPVEYTLDRCLIAACIYHDIPSPYEGGLPTDHDIFYQTFLSQIVENYPQVIGYDILNWSNPETNFMKLCLEDEDAFMTQVKAIMLKYSEEIWLE